MVLKKVLLLVEGDDDSRFIKKIIIPIINNFYSNVSVREYIQLNKKLREILINNYERNGDDIFVFADYDNTTCISNKIKSVRKNYNFTNSLKIFIVKKEIESWYIAGIDDALLIKYKLSPIEDTENLSKKFIDHIGTQDDSILECKLQLLKSYSITKQRTETRALNIVLKNYKIL